MDRDSFTKHFTYEELNATLDILDLLRHEYTTKRMKEKHQLAVMKYRYWLLISNIRGNSAIIIGGN